MPTRNNGPGTDVLQGVNFGRSGARIGNIGQQFHTRCEARMRAAELRRLNLMQREVKKNMPEIMDAIRAEQNEDFAMRNDSLFDLQDQIHRIFRKIKTSLMQRELQDDLFDELNEIGQSARRSSLDTLKKVARQTLGLGLAEGLFSGAEYDSVVSSWAQQNVQRTDALIDSTLNRMEEVVSDGVMRRREAQEIEKDLQRRFDAAKSRAQSTATDQVGSLDAKVTQMQHEAAGMKRYEWSTSLDERVRECHAEFEGKIFSYDDPPEIWYMTKHGKVYTGRHCNPGEDYNCRCVDYPVLEEETLNPAAFTR